MGRIIISLIFILFTSVCFSQKIKEKHISHVRGEITRSFLSLLDHVMDTDEITSQITDSLSFAKIVEIHVESFSMDSVPIFTYYSETNLNFKRSTPFIYKLNLLKKERIDYITFTVDFLSGKDFRVECSLTADPINSERVIRSMNIDEAD